MYDTCVLFNSVFLISGSTANTATAPRKVSINR